MPETDFGTSGLETEIDVTHIGDGQVYQFPILFDGAVSLAGFRLEPNPATREAPLSFRCSRRRARRFWAGRQGLDKGSE
jgi:hypothetical protein